MEGPSIRCFPRISLRNPVELRVGNKVIRIQEAVGNLSAGGLFINAEDVPVSAAIHVKISAAHPFEAEGIVRFCEPQGGVGIEFTSITNANRKRLDELIVELTEKEVLAS